LRQAGGRERIMLRYGRMEEAAMRRTVWSLVSLAAIVSSLVVASVASAGPSGSKGYLIGSSSPLTAAQVSELRDAGARIAHIYENFGGAAAVIPANKLDAVRSLPFVTSLNEDTIKRLDATAAPGAAPLPGSPYWLDLIDAERNTAYTGQGVWVAVLDSGFYPNWRDYFVESDILTQYAAAFVSANGNPNANQWDVGSDPHGMAVSATIVGHRFVDDTNEGGWGEGYVTGSAGTYWHPGVAPNAKIIPVKVCEPIGCFGSAINAGVDYIISLKLANPSQPIVINESLGGPRLDALEKAAIDAAVKAGVVMVASAGNGGNAGMGFPGAYEPVISAGAGGWIGQYTTLPGKGWYLQDVPEDDLSQIYVAGFSARQLTGQFLDVVSTGRYLLLPYPCAQLYKDGQVISSTNVRTCASKATPDNASAAPFQYLWISGTSFSAPTISGIAALMLDKDPTLSNADATFGTLLDPGSWGPGSFERALEGSATDIAPGSVTVTHRTGEPLLECWEVLVTDHPECTTLEATGAGWVFVDDALAAA
jgi:Subtilase family